MRTLGDWMPAGLMLMDILAWSTRRNKERKVFFSHRRWCAAAETGRGRAVYPAAQFPCYLSHCFFPLACSPAGAATAQKGWHSVKPLNLASSQGSSTFYKLSVINIAADTGMLLLCYAYPSMYSQIVQRSESPVSQPSHTRKQLAVRDTPITSVAIFLWRHSQIKTLSTREASKHTRGITLC